MSLTTAINSALSGLNVNQEALAILSNNIANANTPGYSKETVNQQAVYLAGTAGGVTVADVSRKVNTYLQQSIQQQGSANNYASTMNTYLGNVQQLLGTPGSSNSVDSYITGFFNAMQSLEQTPNDTTLQAGVISSAQTLTSQVSQLASGLQNIRFQADQGITSTVNAVNSDLTQIHALNGQIANNLVLGNSVAELQDQRDTLVNDMSQYINVQTFTRSDGSINITTGNGVSLLDDNVYKLSYAPIASTSPLINNSVLQPIQVTRVDSAGNPAGAPLNLVTGGTSSQVTSTISSGQLKALLDVRDQVVPGMLSQLDTLTAQLRDSVNAIHNEGTGFPGSNSYTGTSAVTANSLNQWNGSISLSVLDGTGAPAASPYSTETQGIVPLNVNLSQLNYGAGSGYLTPQNIVDYINQNYGSPANKVELGNLNNVQLVSDSKNLTGTPPQLSFNLGLQNLSTASADTYVTGLKVLDSNGNDITNITQNAPQIAVSSFTTVGGSKTVTVNSGSTTGLSNGSKIYLNNPGVTVDGIQGSDFQGTFTVTNVTANSFQITVADASTNTNGTNTNTTVSNEVAVPTYATVAAGQTLSSAGSTITANLSGAPGSQYYTVQATVLTDNGGGTLKSSTITYRVNNTPGNLLNNVYSAQAANGSGTIITPSSNQPLVVAKLVDANGNELPKVNGQYVTNQAGYLQISAGTSSNIVAIDSKDSAENGQPNVSPPVAGTGDGLSYYFGLNNFFVDPTTNQANASSANSAINLAIEKRLVANPGLVSTGTLLTVKAPAGSTQSAYAYGRSAADGSIAQAMADAGLANFTFSSNGGLGTAVTTLSGYAGQIIGAASMSATAAKNTATTAQSLLDGYTQQESAVSGVNLDQELANTVIYQNAYSASARVISVTSSLFNALLQSVSGQ